MAMSLAERSGRSYPHNAIYEILTYHQKKDEIDEPLIYNDKTVEFYHSMLIDSTQEILLSYVDVFELGLTLEVAGKRRKCSSSKVRKNLNEVYFLQDSDGFKVNKLRLLSRK